MDADNDRIEKLTARVDDHDKAIYDVMMALAGIIKVVEKAADKSTLNREQRRHGHRTVILPPGSHK